MLKDRYVILWKDPETGFDGEPFGVPAESVTKAKNKAIDYLKFKGYPGAEFEIMTFANYLEHDMDVYDEDEIESYWELMNICWTEDYGIEF